jgi:hypothetical protein
MWFDTSSEDIYSGPTLDGNNLVSTSLVLDPYFTGFNDPSTYSGLIGLGGTQPWTIDSIEISGIYGRSNSRTTSVDTLRICITDGLGNSTSNIGVEGWESPTTATTTFPFVPYGTDTLLYLQTYHDSVKNVMTNQHPVGTTLGAAVFTQDIYLTNTDTSGNFDRFIELKNSVGVATPYTPSSTSAFPAMSLTFISGDAGAPHTGVSTDTVFTGDSPNPYRYGMFRPLVVYKSDGTGTPEFMPYTVGATARAFTATNDINSTLFKVEPTGSWSGLYLPNWAFSSGSGASTDQYAAWGSMHIVCPTCPFTESLSTPAVQKVVSGVVAYPNPATSQLTVGYNASNTANVTVSLTNMVGQVVATQKGTNGSAIFATSNLADGMYIYTILANGERTTGHVAIAH